MKAAYIEQFGPPDVIRFGDLPMPRVGPRDVLVRVAAVGVDGSGACIRSGAYPVPVPMPFIIGRDLVGTVVETGPEVAEFRPGDWVWANNQGYDGRQGSFSEYCAVEQNLLYPLPEDLDPLPAAAVLHSGLTAVRRFSSRLACNRKRRFSSMAALAMWVRLHSESPRRWARESP